jgi:hypothetical protein
VLLSFTISIDDFMKNLEWPHPSVNYHSQIRDDFLQARRVGRVGTPRRKVKRRYTF